MSADCRKGYATSVECECETGAGVLADSVRPTPHEMAPARTSAGRGKLAGRGEQRRHGSFVAELARGAATGAGSPARGAGEVIDEGPVPCGGIEGLACSEGFTCVFDPAVCDPAGGGGDCLGVCRPTCGANVCGSGEFCCNESCGICAPIGGRCTLECCNCEWQQPYPIPDGTTMATASGTGSGPFTV